MVRLRKARLADVPVLARMEARYALDQMRLVEKVNPRICPYMLRRPGKSGEIRKWLRECIRSTNARIFLAEVDGKPVGLGVISIQTSPPIRRLRHCGRIDLLYVEKAHRGMGISSLMVREALAWFKKRGVGHLSLQVINDNLLARSIYRKWGFWDFFVEMRREL